MLDDMIKENWVEVTYLHKLTEDIGATLKAGIVLNRTSDSKKLEHYSTWNGYIFFPIPPGKVKVYQLTTKHTVEELPVE